MKRVAAIVVIALAGGCSSGNHQANPPSKSSAIAATTSTTVALPSTSPNASTTIPPGTPPCRASTLAAHGGRQGGGLGSARGDISIVNTGGPACYLSGIPTIALIDSHGNSLAVQLLPPQNPPALPVLLTNSSTSQAWLVVSWFNWCGPTPGPLQLRITLANNSGTLVAPFNGPPDYDYTPTCGNAQMPSMLQVLDAYNPIG